MIAKNWEKAAKAVLAVPGELEFVLWKKVGGQERLFPNNSAESFKV